MPHHNAEGRLRDDSLVAKLVQLVLQRRPVIHSGIDTHRRDRESTEMHASNANYATQLCHPTVETPYKLGRLSSRHETARISDAERGTH